jgi:hypothetical protein
VVTKHHINLETIGEFCKGGKPNEVLTKDFINEPSSVRPPGSFLPFGFKFKRLNPSLPDTDGVSPLPFIVSYRKCPLTPFVFQEEENEKNTNRLHLQDTWRSSSGVVRCIRFPPRERERVPDDPGCKGYATSKDA